MLSLQQELQTLRAENAALRQQLQQLQSERIKSPATDAASSHQLERMLGEVLRLQRESAATALGIACNAHAVASIHPKVFLPLRDTLTGRHLALLASGPTLQQAPRIDGCLQ